MCFGEGSGHNMGSQGTFEERANCGESMSHRLHRTSYAYADREGAGEGADELTS